MCAKNWNPKSNISLSMDVNSKKLLTGKMVSKMRLVSRNVGLYVIFS